MFYYFFPSFSLASAAWRPHSEAVQMAEEQAAAAVKYEAVLAMEAAGKEVSFAGDVKESANAGIAAANALFGR